ncbi:hypothetical protein [Dethiothermospora halolimnae]|uniref:hypothetical protein n=1 Tax=Dethiothermospora halolimnae TaxID=3114390 RepID=UPI003CCBEA8D
MSFFRDLYYINRKCVKDTLKLFGKNWLIIFIGIAYPVISIVLMKIIGILSMSFILSLFAGLILIIAESAITSNFLYLLYNIVNHGKFTVQDFKDGFKVYLWKIYTVFFIGWIARFVFDQFIARALQGILPFLSYIALALIIQILVLLLLNPLPEAIYQKHYSSWESIVYAFKFIKDNWIEWFIPNIIFMLILYYSTGTIISDVLAYNTGVFFNVSVFSIVRYLLGQLIFSFTMIYRGVLFDILSTSNRRKRMFMLDLYK